MNVSTTAPFTAMTVLGFAAKNNVFGKLVRSKRNGREVREYVIDGKTHKVEAWPTEHTIAE